jgi:hypothetical protein
VDEAHHLVQTNKEEDKKSYHTLLRVLSLLHNKKLLVMTGTPIRDQPDEVVPLLNMVLPPDRQLSRTDFLSTFFMVKEQVPIFDNIKIPVYDWKEGARTQFIQNTQGYVSYVKRRISDALVQYQGKTYAPMTHIRIVAHRMDPFQNMVYTDIFRRERMEENTKSSFYSQSKQAALFVFPNEQTGEKGFKQYVSSQFVLRPSFLETIGDYKNMPSETVLGQLRQFSASYASVLQQILDNPKELVYVFSDLVEGSGILLFMSILKTLFGFKLITSKSDLVDTKGDRMILLNDRVAHEEDFQDFIQYFNRPENKHGDYCQIVMSTNKTKEGISLKNVRQIHILTPSWNIADTSQAMSRSLRARSHQDLTDPVVRIFLHVSVPFLGEEDDEDRWLRGELPFQKDELLFSVDFQRYYRSEIKERNAKLLDRAFLESSWDCLMNTPHNRQSGRTEDYSRECEYEECAYTCYGVSEDTQPASDSANANLFYSEEERLGVVGRIQSYFSQHRHAVLPDFLQAFPEYSPVLVEMCLDHVVHQPIVLRDCRGLPCFLGYKNGCLFLTDNPYLPVHKENYEVYYQQYPSTRVVFPFPELLDHYFVRHQKVILPRLVRLIQMGSPNAKTLFLSLPLLAQSLFCETTIQSQVLHPSQVHLDARGWFAREFKTDITYIPGVLVAHRFLENKQHSRRLDLKTPQKGWVLVVQ